MTAVPLGSLVLLSLRTDFSEHLTILLWLVKPITFTQENHSAIPGDEFEIARILQRPPYENQESRK